MGDRSAIEWTDATWNPLRAQHRETGRLGWICVHKSGGCALCWAERMNGWRGNGAPYTPSGLKQVDLFLDERALALPLRWRAPRRIFVCSTTDLFGEWWPDEWIDRVFALMYQARQHTYQVLTKRADRMRDWALARQLGNRWSDVWPHVWAGVSVENQPAADARIPLLLQTPAAVRFLSVEPLLGPVDLHCYLSSERCGPGCESSEYGDLHDAAGHRAIDWVIVGSESGPGRRNQDGYEDHARAVIAQARAAGVAVCHKQMPVRGRVSHDPAEWPEDLRVREFPALLHQREEEKSC